jgi:hypothetical protein
MGKSALRVNPEKAPPFRPKDPRVDFILKI